jgi:tRNA(Ile)-lysidine synthase
MIKLIGKIPNLVYLAFSGGIDSVAVASFLAKGKKDSTLLYFNHGTAFGNQSEFFVKEFAKSNNLKLIIGKISREISKEQSKEEFWRIERYKFFSNFIDKPIITCHHLDDQIENWIFTCLHGNPMLIPSKRGNIIRPFVLNRKKVFIDYANQFNLNWMEDPSNQDISFMRNRIRHCLVDNALRVNPGLPKVLIKKIRIQHEMEKINEKQ